MTVRGAIRRLHEQRGEAEILSAILLLAGVLIPAMFLIALFARIEHAQGAAQQAALDAVRSAVQAPDAQAASAAANEALAREQAPGTPLTVSLAGTFTRGQSMTATVTTSVPVGSLPLLGHFGTITLHANASAPVDRYRSILERP
jgi:hypothetical protein